MSDNFPKLILRERSTCGILLIFQLVSVCLYLHVSCVNFVKEGAGNAKSERRNESDEINFLEWQPILFSAEGMVFTK